MRERTKAPFLVGVPIPTVLSSTYLHGYEEERRTIIENLKRRDQAALGIFGRPRSGKTSLMLSVAHSTPEPRIHIQCDRVIPFTPAGFYRVLSQAIGVPTPANLTEPPAVVYAHFQPPRSRDRGVVVLDNADALHAIEPQLLDEMPVLRTRLPHHVVLTGEPQRLRQLVQNHVDIQPFSPGTVADFVHKRFGSAGMRVDDAVVPVLYDLTVGGPDALQRLCRAVWRVAKDRGTNVISVEDVDEGLIAAVDELPSALLSELASLRGNMRDIFVAMALYDLSSPTEIAKRLDLEPKNVVVLLSRLMGHQGLVERSGRGMYRIGDPLLRHYVKKEWGSPILR